MFRRLFKRRRGHEVVDRLHGDIVAAARRPAFYLTCGAPDTFEGRFEILVLHLSVVVRRLERAPPPGPDLAQGLTDSAFAHLDIALREIGVSDIGVPKRMKKLAGDYIGRARVYAEALATPDDEALPLALARNVYSSAASPEDGRVRDLARYVRRMEEALQSAPEADLVAGRVSFPRVEAEGEKP